MAPLHRLLILQGEIQPSACGGQHACTLCKTICFYFRERHIAQVGMTSYHPILPSWCEFIDGDSDIWMMWPLSCCRVHNPRTFVSLHRHRCISLPRTGAVQHNPGISATFRTLNLLSLLALVSYPRRPVFQIESENSSSYTRNAASDAHGDSICYISTFASVPAQNVTKQNWISRQTWFRFPI